MKKPIRDTIGFRKIFLMMSLSYLILTFNGAALADQPFTSDIPANFFASKSGAIGKDPISAANGAYRFRMPLLSLSGPINLQFALLYRSDYSRFFHYLPATFWWEPFSQGFAGYIANNVEYGGIYLPNGDLVSFQKNASGTWDLTDSTLVIGGLTFEDNRPPVKYEMRETANYLYLMDPVKGLVYLLGKYFTAPNGIRYFRILRILDRNNNFLNYVYSANTNGPSRIEDQLGRQLNIFYGAVGNQVFVTRVTDQGGRQVSLGYEAAGADNGNQPTLRSVTDPAGNTLTIHYTTLNNVPNLITSLELPGNNTPYTQTYGLETIFGNSFPRVASQTDAFGHKTTLSYDNTTGTITANYPDGNSERYIHYSPTGYLKSLTDAANKTFQVTKDGDEHITGTTDRLGDKTTIAYHASGKIASITNAKGATFSFVYTPQDQIFVNPFLPGEQQTFTFPGLTQINYPDGTNEQFINDAMGNPQTFVNREQKAWDFLNNSRGQVIEITNPLGGKITNTFNSDATLATAQDSDTGVTSFVHDVSKRPIQIIYPDSTSIQILYNPNDQITGVTDENNNTYMVQLDANGNPIIVTDPNGNATHMLYNLMDQASQITDRLGENTAVTYNNRERVESITDPNNITLTMGYDPRSWWNSITVGGQAWQKGYDDEGVCIDWTTPLNLKTTLQADKLGFVTAVADPLNQTTTFTRNVMNSITGIRNALNVTTTIGYDSNDLPIAVIQPVTGTQTIQMAFPVTGTQTIQMAFPRNDLELVDQFTDGNGQDWLFGYTNMGRRRSWRDPLGNITTRTFNSRGWPSVTTFPDNTTLSRIYDGAGNVTGLNFSAGPNLFFDRDKLNNLIGTNGIGLTRDKEERIIETDNSGTKFGATYAGGRLETASYNDGQFIVNYVYDPVTGLPSGVSDSLTGTQVTFTHDNDGRLTGINRSNNVNTILNWDNANHLTRIRHGNQSGDFIDIQRIFDGAGRVTQEVFKAPSDPANILIPGTGTFTYNEASQINTPGYSYNPNGNLTAAPGITVVWNGAFQATGINNTTFSYNGLGDLRTQTGGGQTTDSYYNYALPNPFVAEKNETTGQFIRFFVHTPGGTPLYIIDPTDNNKVYFIHFDGAGTTLALTDSTGNVTDSYAYGPFGEFSVHQGNNSQSLTFGAGYNYRDLCTSPASGCDNIFLHGQTVYDSATQRNLNKNYDAIERILNKNFSDNRGLVRSYHWSRTFPPHLIRFTNFYGTAANPSDVPFGQLQGTSISSPHPAGAAALYRSLTIPQRRFSLLFDFSRQTVSPQPPAAARLNFPWDIFGNGKTVIRGGYSSAFYDRFAINLPGASSGSTLFLGRREVPGRKPPQAKDNLFSQFGWGNQIIPRFGSRWGDYPTQQDYAEVFLGGIEFEVARSVSLGVRYVHRDIPNVSWDQSTFSGEVEELRRLYGKGWGPAYAIDDQDIVSVMFRFQRNFVP